MKTNAAALASLQEQDTTESLPTDHHGGGKHRWP